jgi:glucosamine--fructose-6-phosphate aminotransferase (isomerizing)
MEYRGYDSVGVATKNQEKILIKKGVGNVAQVNESVKLDSLQGNIGIGHTRWATHGKVLDVNAHPQSSNIGDIAIVHNGIIENYAQLKQELLEQGFSFQSETDTEILANLIQKNCNEIKDIKKSIIKTLSQIKGNYAFAAMFSDGTLVAARFHEPLIVGVGKDSFFLSSDVLGFIEQTDDVIYIDNENFVIVDSTGLQIYDFEGAPVKGQITKVSKEFADIYKGNYAHFTLKEISEQPETIIKAGQNSESAIKDAANIIKDAKNVYITGSGTSYNAALVAKHIMSKYAQKKIEPIISSELPFSPNLIEPDSVLIAISQSGESADVLHAVNIAKKLNAKIISIVNPLTSSLVHESSLVMGMNCGPEIGVAATKSFTSQLAILCKITEQMCRITSHSNSDDSVMSIDYAKVSSAIRSVLDDHSQIKSIAKELKEVSDIYILGRGVHYPIASEAALKLKELTYIHAEGIPGGELKHGPLALMNSGAYVLIINPDDSTYDDTLLSAREIKTRGAKIIGISDKNNEEIYDYWIKIPKMNEAAYPIIEIIPIHLLSYYSAIEKDTNPDYPRNLAKSVTVK